MPDISMLGRQKNVALCHMLQVKCVYSLSLLPLGDAISLILELCFCETHRKAAKCVHRPGLIPKSTTCVNGSPAVSSNRQGLQHGIQLRIQASIHSAGCSQVCSALSFPILAVPQPLDAPSLPSAGSGFLSQPCLNSLLPLPACSTAVILPRQGLALPKLPCACEGQHGLFPVPSWSTWLFLRVNANRAHELHVKPLDS